MAAAQELASVLNAPPTPGAASWLAGWPFGQAFGQEDYDAPPPPLPPGTLPEVRFAGSQEWPTPTDCGPAGSVLGARIMPHVAAARCQFVR